MVTVNGNIESFNGGGAAVLVHLVVPVAGLEIRVEQEMGRAGELP